MIEGVTVGEVGANLRELALGMFGVKFVDAIGEDQLQHGVAEKLETLVVMVALRAALVGDGRMREGLNEEIVVLEFVTDGSLQFLKCMVAVSPSPAGGCCRPETGRAAKSNCDGQQSTEGLPKNRVNFAGGGYRRRERGWKR